MLSVRIRTKRFAQRDVLGPLDFTLGAGEILAIVGPSGCGKSLCSTTAAATGSAASTRIMTAR